jgi:hypothetical protein
MPAPLDASQHDTATLAQVSKQCSAVRHLAAVIAAVYGDHARMFADGAGEQIAERVGRRTAALMETLGDILNGMDAVTTDDDWLTPIFEEAHRRWPTKGCSHCGFDHGADR